MTEPNDQVKKALVFRKTIKVIQQYSGLDMLPDSIAKIYDRFILDGKRVVVYEYCGKKNLLEDVLTSEN